MGKCLEKLPHAACGSSNGLQVYESEDGSINGTCFACGAFVPNPYGQELTEAQIKAKRKLTKTPEEIAEQMQMIAELGTIDLQGRKLRKDVLEYYGIKIGFSEKDGKTPRYAYFPYTESGKIVKYKVKLLGESASPWSVGVSNNVDLFGWEQAKASGAKRLIITEGEFDAPAGMKIAELYTKDTYKDYLPAFVSIPNGAGSAKRDLARLLPEIKKFFKEEDIYLAFDGDEAGHKAVGEVSSIMPQVKSITLPAKDFNDCLKEGKGKAAHKAMQFNASKNKNTRLVWGEEIHAKAKEPAAWGLSWPWEGMTKLTRGIRGSETYYIGAGEKMGKSDLLNAIGAHIMVEHGKKILVAKPEEAVKKTYKMMCSKVVGKVFHDPNVEFDNEAYERAGELIRGKLCMLDLYQNITWDILKQDIYAAHAKGCWGMFIDPITNLTNGMSSSMINEHLQGVAQDLAVVAKDLDVPVFIFCHLNKPAKGCTPWDRGGKITTDYFAGSSAMARSCNYAFGLEGNRDPELPKIEQNIRRLVALADREFGEAGYIDLSWNPKTTLFTEL